jgi:hypothetical protein
LRDFNMAISRNESEGTPTASTFGRLDQPLTQQGRKRGRSLVANLLFGIAVISRKTALLLFVR